MERIAITTKPQQGYELLDTGNEQKLERYGRVVLARPDPQALWPATLPQAQWQKADAYFERKGREGEWQIQKSLPKQWKVDFGGLHFYIRATSFKHTGL